MIDVIDMARRVAAVMQRKRARHVLFLCDSVAGFYLVREGVTCVAHYDRLEFVGVYGRSVSRSKIERDLLFNGAINDFNACGVGC